MAARFTSSVRDDTSITVKIGKGIRAARGGNETKDELEAVVTIPGRTSLRFDDAQMTLVDNARYEPEQILLVTSSSPVGQLWPILDLWISIPHNGIWR
jgi:hypothetical protein